MESTTPLKRRISYAFKRRMGRIGLNLKFDENCLYGFCIQAVCDPIIVRMA